MESYADNLDTQTLALKSSAQTTRYGWGVEDDKGYFRSMPPVCLCNSISHKIITIADSLCHGQVRAADNAECIASVKEI